MGIYPYSKHSSFIRHKITHSDPAKAKRYFHTIQLFKVAEDAAKAFENAEYVVVELVERCKPCLIHHVLGSVQVLVTTSSVVNTNLVTILCDELGIGFHPTARRHDLFRASCGIKYKRVV